MANVVKGMDQAMKAMDLEKVYIHCGGAARARALTGSGADIGRYG